MMLILASKSFHFLIYIFNLPIKVTHKVTYKYFSNADFIYLNFIYELFTLLFLFTYGWVVYDVQQF